ncbi:hypothetical protein GIB67_038015 [Kingdonia uniflora]|uniref:Uncharacterized protein n=1 Tax=Kingdonia uniflora TaxID=39325 RepID=A0A7J7LHD7_9MAGN|nr:hypothetical protein GIB67_038015 [Kingdonia uniflora]
MKFSLISLAYFFSRLPNFSCISSFISIFLIFLPLYLAELNLRSHHSESANQLVATI